MNTQDISKYIARITSRTHIYQDIVIKYPSSLIKQKSFIYYDEIIEEIKYDGFLWRDDMKQTMFNRGFVDRNIENNIKQLEVTLDNKKLEAYNIRYDSKTVNFIKKQIETIKSNINNLYGQLYAYDFCTMEGYAEYCRQMFLLLHTSYQNRKQIKPDGVLVDILYRHLLNNQLTQEDIRQISKAAEWRTIWNACRGKPFKQAAAEFSEEQRSLVLFTKMYDNAYKHPDCPDDTVLNDDILFDGWQIWVRKKAEKERQEKSLDAQFGDADVVSLPAKNKEQARQIHSMNSPTNLHTMKMRAEAIKQKGKLSYTELPDVQLEMQMEANKKR